jgi:hypothetical protein
MSSGEGARLQSEAPNPSIERTSLSWLRQPKAAAHVERSVARWQHRSVPIS